MSFSESRFSGVVEQFNMFNVLHSETFRPVTLYGRFRRERPLRVLIEKLEQP